MIPPRFQYFAPTSLKEALSLLKKYPEDTKILAGGMSLIPLMKLRLASPPYLVDMNRIPGLEYIKQRGNLLLIGSMTRHHSIETSKLLKEKAPILPETAGWIGDPQVRNMGTIGGSLAHCDPSGDWGSAVIAARGEVEVRSPEKGRLIKIDDFLVDTFTTALKPSELLVEVRIPVPPVRSGGAYMKFERKAGDFATVGVAVQITVDGHDVCTSAGIGLTAVGPKNLRAEKAEMALRGRKLTASVIEEAALAASEDGLPTSDPLRGSAEYKKEMTRVFTRRGLELALRRAKGGK